MRNFRPKLIALDLDGTILNSESRLTERTKSALQRAMGQGLHVLIATGRMYSSALAVIREIGTSSPCVFYNGAVIIDPVTDEVFYEKGLGRDLTAEVVDFYRRQGWYIQIYSDDMLYVLDNEDPRCKFYESIAKIDAVPLGEGFWNFRVNAIKLLGIAHEEEIFKKMLGDTKNHFGKRLYTTTSWGSFVEMVHPDVNKALGLEMAAKRLGITRKEILAIGDASNDKEMISWAGLGVAMGNAPDEVKAEADEIAPDNDHDGAAVTVERFLI